MSLWIRTVTEIIIALSLILIISTDMYSPHQASVTPREISSRNPDHTGLAGTDSTTITSAQVEKALRGSRSTNVNVIIDRLIEREVLYAAACRAGVDNEPDLLNSIRELIASTYLKRLGVEEISLTEAEVHAWYRRNGDRYLRSERRSAAVILTKDKEPPGIKSPSGVDSRVQRILEEAGQSSDGDFGKLAATYSDHAGSRFKGGRIGWITENDKQYPVEVVNALFALKNIGDIAEPIKLSGECWILKMLDRQVGGVPPFESMLERVRYEAERETARDRRNLMMETLKQQHKVWVDADAVRKFIAEYQKKIGVREDVPQNQ